MSGIWWALGVSGFSLAVLGYYAFIYLPAQLHRWRCAGLKALSQIVVLRTGGRYGKPEPMVSLASHIALELGLSLQERRRLELAVYLRDIGMVGIPYNVLNAQERSSTEQMVFEHHPEMGAAIAEQIPGLGGTAPIVRYHHAVYSEQTDAPIGALILSALEEFLSLSDKAGIEQALATLRGGAGERFHPEVVEALCKVVRTRTHLWGLPLDRAAALWL
ncbi:MAG: HD domain-containing phosphohydrolase [Fimbriimonadales bacterium]